MMFDATDLEIDRRETAYEMGAEALTDRAWSIWYNAAEKAVIARGWDGKFDNGKSRGLDGNEYTDEGEPSDGYSIDGAYEAWEAHWSVERYIANVAAKRGELGL
jgi:hypothetical protein